MNRPSFRPRPSCRSIAMSMSKRSRAMSIVPTIRRMTIDDLPHAEDRYQNEVPRVRRRSLTLLMAICGLALIGSACAFGYRDMFGGAALPPPTVGAINEPYRTAPAPGEPQAESSGNARQVGAATTGSIDNMVSREEQPPRRLGPRKRLRVVRCPARSRPRRLPPVRRCRTERCPEKRSLRILPGLIQPSPLRRSAPKTRARRTSRPH